MLGGIFLDANSFVTELGIGAAGVVFDGAGSITLSNSPHNRITGTNNSATDAFTLGTSMTLQGAGEVGRNDVGITNHGVITANGSNPLILDPSFTLGFTNTGTLRATGSSTLKVTGGSYFNTNGDINAETGTIVEIDNASVSGGAITTFGTGEIKLASSTLSNVTLTNSATGKVRTISGTSSFGGSYIDAAG